MRDLNVKTAGIGARSLGIEIEAIDQHNTHTLAGQKKGAGRAGQTATDNQNVGFHAALLRSASPASRFFG